MAPAKRARGIRRHGAGWQAYVQVGGVMHWCAFPLETPLETMQAWRHRQKAAGAAAAREAQAARLAAARGEAPVATLGRDIEAYLASRTAMPTYRERKQHLAWWLEALGDRPRATITPLEIDAVLYRWRQTLAAQTVRLRRTALRSLWHAIDGRHAPNPVRASWSPRAPQAARRTVHPALLEQALAAVTSPRQRARLLVLATTGLPHALIMALTPEDLDLPGKRLRAHPRRKGAGTAAVWLPISPVAVRALKAFAKADAWGRFSASSLRKAWIRACRQVGLIGVRPYDLRHAFAAALYRARGDLATVQRLLLHADIRTTQRYAQDAEAELDRDTVAVVGRAQAKGLRAAITPPRRNLPGKLASRGSRPRKAS